ncbi:hypothetical protein B0T17DRAFT_537131 [Bombardia bombarda]|uniref:DUS-like FMN-binding domain-containing protein n=1 Tax=Bombardia bombarda TaxID=252184 RepID=A0AA40BYG6_9PEZI|nr:hypothetical protein B0T17DRAFT_537131 [Bombardia bombarda]
MRRFACLLRGVMVSTSIAEEAAATSVATATMTATATPAIAATPARVPIPPRGVDYRGKLALAPMVRSGELPSRLLALHYGADLVWGPETVDHSLIGSVRRVNPRTNMIEWTRIPSNQTKHETPAESVIYRLDPLREGSKHVFQIGTSDPERAVAAARLVAADVAGIDVNAGCPKPFSTSGGMGAALLQTPDKLAAILEALVREIPPAFGIGISVKIRLLETPERTGALVRRLVATGITGLTLHCRTTPMRPRERAIREQLRMVAGVCREAGVACLMNGDVAGRDEAEALVEEYGVDGAMIATAAEKNPSVFRAGKDGGMAGWREAVERYVRFAMEAENKFGNTKYLLGQMIPGKEQAIRELPPCKSYVKTVEMLGFGGLVELARATDEVLGLGEKKKVVAPVDKSAAGQGANKKRKWTDNGGRNKGGDAKRQQQHQTQQTQTQPHPAPIPTAVAATTTV